MAQHKSRKKSVALITAVGMTVAGTGVAFAYWTSTGTGTGTATTGTSATFLVTSSPPQGDPLSPNGPIQTVAFTVANPGTGVQTLSEVNVKVASAGGTAWTPAGGCTAADYTVSISTAPTYGPIQPGDDVTGTASIQMIDTMVNQDGCKGLTVPLYFEADALVV